MAYVDPLQGMREWSKTWDGRPETWNEEVQAEWDAETERIHQWVTDTIRKRQEYDQWCKENKIGDGNVYGVLT